MRSNKLLRNAQLQYSPSADGEPMLSCILDVAERMHAAEGQCQIFPLQLDDDGVRKLLDAGERILSEGFKLPSPSVFVELRAMGAHYNCLLTQREGGIAVEFLFTGNKMVRGSPFVALIRGDGNHKIGQTMTSKLIGKQLEEMQGTILTDARWIVYMFAVMLNFGGVGSLVRNPPEKVVKSQIKNNLPISPAVTHYFIATGLEVSYSGEESGAEYTIKDDAFVRLKTPVRLNDD